MLVVACNSDTKLHNSDTKLQNTQVEQAADEALAQIKEILANLLKRYK